jgi:phage/plasmid-associated DNA primase
LVLFAFLHETSSDDADHSLQTKLAREKSGVLNWALEIFTEEYLRDECRSIMAPDEYGQQELTKWRRVNNPALEWAKDRMNFNGDNALRVTISEAYEDYSAWCRREGHHRAAKNHFSRVLNRHYEYVKDGYGKPIYVGVELEPITYFEALQ